MRYTETISVELILYYYYYYYYTVKRVQAMPR